MWRMEFRIRFVVCLPLLVVIVIVEWMMVYRVSNTPMCC